MALITGSSTINWSGVALDHIDVQQNVDEFSSRFKQALTEYNNGTAQVNSSSSTFVLLTLSAGEKVTIRGSGFFITNDSVVTSAVYSNPSTGEVASFIGTVDLHFGGNFGTIKSMRVSSLTISNLGVPTETITGNIVVNLLSGNASGSLTQLKRTLGFDVVTIKGSLVLSANDVVSGTVTQISVLSGANRIVMSGLAVPYSALDSVTTVNDLFFAVGSQMTGNDTIAYTNNSVAGMTFFGGAGNDTITISGTNGDTLNGGDGNDQLTGGLGQDTVNGDVGDDRITMLVTAGNVDTIDAGNGTDTLVLSGVVPGDHMAVVDLSSTTDQVVSIGGVADALTQIKFENLNASGIGSAVIVTGNAGVNILIGSKGNDNINGGAGHDAMSGGLGNDTYVVDSAGDVVTEALNAGTDKVFSSIDYTLTANVDNLEVTGSDNLNGTGNALANILTGNGGDNVLTGNAGNDTLIGGLGQDTVTGGSGNDRIVMQVTAGDVDLADGGVGSDTLALDGVVDGDGVVVVDLSSLTDQVTRIGTVDPESLVQKNFENLDATGLIGSVIATGSAGANLMIGSTGNDQLTGGAATTSSTGEPATM